MLIVLAIIAGCGGGGGVHPPRNDQTKPEIRVELYDIPPFDAADTDNPHVWSGSFPTRVRAKLGKDVGVVAKASDPESGIVWLHLTADYRIVCRNIDGKRVNVIGLDPPSLNDHSGPILKDTDPFPPEPYQVSRIVNFTVPLNVTPAVTCPQGETTTMEVNLILSGRAGNGPYISQMTVIAAG